MRRNEMLIDSREDALQWLEEFEHTITDEPLKRVIEVLKVAVDECDEEASSEICRLKDNLHSAESLSAALQETVEELEATVESLLSK